MNLLTLERFRPRDITFILHLAPLALVYLLGLTKDEVIFETGNITQIIFTIISVFLIAGSGLLIEQKKIGKWLIQGCLLSAIAITLNYSATTPLSFLIGFIILASIMYFINGVGQARNRHANRQNIEAYSHEMTYYSIILNALALAALYLWRIDFAPLSFAAMLYSSMLTLALFFLAFKKIFLSLWSGLFLQIMLVTLIGLSLTFLLLDHQLLVFQALMLIPPLAFMHPSIRGKLKNHLIAYGNSLYRFPESAVMAFFVVLSFIGSLFLYSTVSSSTEQTVSFIDAAFTAVSAACVTGLIVLDTPVAYSFFGQLIILILFQLGGLGVMAISSLLFLIMGRRMSLSQEDTIFSTGGQMLKGEAFSVLKQILAVTFLFEIIGAVILAGLFFIEGDAPIEAIWRGIFTAVSAFCNAGFAIQVDSLVNYQHNSAILHTTGILIVAGGLSPAFVIAIPNMLKGDKIPLQFKVVALATVFLLFSGTLTYLLLEWNRTLLGLNFADKLNNAWFQSITTRTAGFNSVDFSSLHSATIFVMMALMFIGGSPGGSAGGVRTTTFMILVYTLVSSCRGHQDVRAFGRVISQRSVYRAATVTATGILVGFIGLLSLLTTQRLEPIEALFEVVSAAGTVGLSLGVTSQLDQVGKMIVMILMLLGRVGSLTVLLYLGRQSHVDAWKYPQDEVQVV